MTFFAGRQATFTQAPPIIDRSTTTIFWPCFARVQARILPATPLPMTTFWKCSMAMGDLLYWPGVELAVSKLSVQSGCQRTNSHWLTEVALARRFARNGLRP